MILFPKTVKTPPKFTPKVIAEPTVNVGVIDNTFGLDMMITKVSDPTVTKNYRTGMFLGHDYSKEQFWNADETLIKVASRQILENVKGYKTLDLSNAGGTSRWSNLRPDIQFSFGSSAIFEYNVKTKVKTEIINFKHLLPDTNRVYLGQSEGTLSVDDKYVLVNIVKNKIMRNILVDLTKGIIISNKSCLELGFPDQDYFTVSKSGKYIIGNVKTEDPEQQKILYDLNFKKLKEIGTGSHRDAGLNAYGEDIYARAGLPSATNLETLEEYCPYTISEWREFWIKNATSGHSSMAANNNPEWVYLSTSGILTPGCIFSFRAHTGPPEMKFWVPTRRGNTAFSYSSEVKGSPSRSGDKIIYDSDWLKTPANTRAYIAEVAK